MVCLRVDNLSGRLPCDGIMEAILYHRIEIFCCRRVLVIVGATLCIDVRNLLPNATFACTDRTHTFKQFTEVIFTEYRRSLFQPLIVHSEALFDILIENLCCPLTETSGFQRRHAIAYGNDCIERIICRCVVLAVSGSCFHFGNN